MHIMHALLNSLFRGRMQRAAAGHVKIFTAGAVNVVLEIENAFICAIGSLNKHSAGAIAKEDAGGAIPVIEDGGHGIAADSHDFLVCARANELRANSECVGKS